MPNINPLYSNAYGFWQVTTEGDEEGRTTRVLGTFKGRIDEIAFALAERSFYKLTFKAVDLSIPEPTKIHETVHVSFDIDSGIWDMNNVEIADLAKHIMHGSDVIVKESNYFASFLLSREHKMQEIKKQRALAKLTPEERELLGLN